MRTGWINEPADDESPALPLTGMLLARGECQTSALEIALARTRGEEARADRQAAASAPDADERCANMIAAGLAPGQVSELAQRHADAVRAAQGEREKIAAGERAAERVRGMLERGQIGALEASRLMDPDPDPDTGDSKFGDAHRAEQLEARAESLGRQLADAQAMASPPPQRDADPLEAASRRAHEAFVSATRAAIADAEAGVRRSGPRPFAASASASRGGGTEHTGPGCLVCAEVRHMEAGPDPYPPDAVITTGYGEASRYVPAQACSGCGNVYCRCGVAGALVDPPAGTPFAVYP